MKNAQRIIMNQYFTTSPIFSNVKSLLILPALLTVLFIVTACGGVTIAPTLVEASTTADPCLTDPFGDGCDTPEAESARDIKITECLADDAATTPTCESAVAANSCLTNPFDTACENNADFAKYLKLAKKARTTLCTDNNPFNELCTGTYQVNDTDRLAFCRDTAKTTDTKTADCAGSLISDACVANPFDTLCTGDYATNADAELAFCRDDSKTTDTKTADCAGRIGGICTDNPFDNLCTDDSIARLTFCRDTDTTSDNKATDCTGTITTACVANPFAQTTGTTVGDLCVGNDKPDADDIVAFCRDDSKTTDTKTADCAATISGVCTDNPFDNLCTDDSMARLTFCRDTSKITDTKGNDCEATIRTACVNNAFDTLCVDDYETDGVAELAFCRNTSLTTTTKEADCTGTITTACVANPFAQTTGTTVGALCIGNDLPDADGITAFCRDATKPTDTKTADCAPTVERICIQGMPDPFDVLCTITDEVKIAFCRVGTNAVDRAGDCITVITPLCEGNPNDPLCPPKITAGDWVSSFTSVPLNTNPTVGNQFLQIADKTISTMGTTSGPNGADGDTPFVFTLDFSAFTNGGIASGLDANDGLAYFAGHIGADNYLYAGIFETTDLGAPITDDTLSATWAGKLLLNGDAVRNFNLTVTFDGTDGMVDAFIVDIVSSFDFLIDGEFDANGVITGGVHLAEFDGDVSTAIATPNGALSGIIGQDGAVGVFYENGGSDFGIYIGGFVASPVNARKTLATECVLGGAKNNGILHSDCMQTIDVAGTTVAMCSENPYLAACQVAGVSVAFEDVRTARISLCAASDDPFNALCNGYPEENAQQVDYCAEPSRIWQTRCNDVMDDGNRIGSARATICIGDGAIVTGDATSLDAGMSLFNAICNGYFNADTTVADARIALAKTCLTTSDATGCTQPANDGGKTVAQCSANPYDNTTGLSSCNANAAFAVERTDRQALCMVAATSFDALCDIVETSDISAGEFPAATNNARDTYCTDTAPFEHAGCGRTGRTATICLSGGTRIFATLCGTDTTVQNTACLTSGTNAGTGNDCATRANVREACDNNPFTQTTDGTTGNLCIGYDVARGAACVAGTIAAIASGGCGDEDSGYIQAYCADGGSADAANNVRYCPTTAYERANATSADPVVANTLKDIALNATGTALLGDIFVDTGSANSTDDAASFIVDDTASSNTVLELGGNVESALNESFLTLNALSTVDNNATSGFAVAQGVFNSGVINKLYVGLLNGTNLGAPLVAGFVDATWKAKLLGINGITPVTESAEFTLDVSFTDKTITTNNTAPAFGALGTIDINGKFTANGLIYGGVSFGGTDANNGTLTGLIGVGGAVGIFKSDVGNATAYVGGFVLAPPPLEPVTATDWVGSFTSPALNTAPDLANLKSGFLQIADKTIDTNGLKSDVNAFNENAEMLVEPNVHSMNFSTGLFDGRAIGGNADNGFTNFNGRTALDAAIYHFAGIYGSTDLGVPLTLNNNLSATWNGRIQLNSFPADFVLSVGFDGTDGTLDGFVVNYSRGPADPSGDGDILIDGTFDASGLISGTVTLAGFAGNVKDGARLNGVAYESNLTGIIGSDGAVGVFFLERTFAGGFIAGPDIAFNSNVAYGDWTRSFDVPLNYDPTARSQFLQTAGKKISIAGTTLAANGAEGDTPTVNTLDFSDFTYARASLGLSDDDGVAFFTGYIGGSSYQYAGIYDTTDLGAPIIDSSFNATWTGKLLLNGDAVRNFNLTVTFDGTDGMVGAFLTDISEELDFLIDGRFDANGVITGGVHYAEFMDNDKEAITDRDGTLSGLIGSDGAVGVFYGQHSGNDANYSGGFVAIPTATGPIATACARDSGDPICLDDDVTRVTAEDWTRGQKFALNTIGGGGTQFLKIVGKRINIGSTSVFLPYDYDTNRRGDATGPPTVRALDFSDLSYGGESLGLDDDGLAWFSGNYATGFGGRVSYYLAGIYGTTDLGAPIIDDTFNATWAGKFQMNGVSAKDFDLTVTFGGTTGTVDGFIVDVDDDYDFLIDGKFNASGVITGGVHYAEFADDLPTSITDRAGILSGIIGQDGAVGVFRTLNRPLIGQRGNSGGFIASPVVNICKTNVFDVRCPVRENPKAIAAFCEATNYSDPLCPPTVRASDWVSSFTTPVLNTNPTAKNQFLQIAGKTISKVGVSGAPSVTTLDFSDFTYDRASLGLDDKDGLAYFQGSIGGSSFQYAGIYSITDLGAPIIDDSFNATWAGKFRIDGVSAKDFDLTVTFGGTTGTVDGFLIDVNGDTDFLIDGEFGANGVITGGVHYAEFTDNDKGVITDRDGTLSGLIGENGAVGLFYGTNYAGGFVASAEVNQRICAINSDDPVCPDDDVTKVTASDWLRAQPARLNTHPTAKDQFLQIAGKRISTGSVVVFRGAPPTVRALDFSEITYGGVSLGLDDDDGLAFFSGGLGIPSPSYYFAGIYGTTDLGAPITDDTFSATWAGKLRIRNRSADFDLTVTFDGTDGMIDGFIVDLLGGTDVLIDGKFNASGAITGDVHYAEFADNIQTDITNFNGTLLGIIGQDGAVGVFHGTTQRYAGGFIASSVSAICAMNVFDARCPVRDNPQAQAAFCTDNNPNNPLCPDDDVTKVTTGDWLRSFDAQLNTAPDLASLKSEFLQIPAKTISTSGLQNQFTNGFGDAIVHSMNFSTGTFNDLEIRGDADNGFTHFNGRTMNSATYYHFAGIYGSTDLGAPLILDNNLSATWNGRVQLNSFPADFVLSVGFDGTDGTLDGFVVNYSRGPADPSGDGDLLIDGTFDASGVISGTVTLAWFEGNVKTGAKMNDVAHEANLTGIIGQGGAVGVFVHKVDSLAGYAGGFIAGPNIAVPDSDPSVVNYADWLRGFGSPLNINATRKNQFLQVVDKTISTANGGANVYRFRAPSGIRTLDFTAFSSGIVAGLNADDGFTYYQGNYQENIRGRGIDYYYAGIYGTTDLGAPITDNSMNAIWDGKIRADGGGHSVTDFSLAVTFDGRIGTVKGFVVNVNPRFEYDILIDGKFDANGIIKGNYHYAEFDDDTNPTPPATFNGTLSGIISQEGAVGVFYGDSGQGWKYAGGFIAIPDAPDTVTATDWVGSFTSPALSDVATAGNKFLQLSGSTANLGNLKRDSAGTSTRRLHPRLVHFNFLSSDVDLTSGLDGADGFAHVTGYIGGNRYAYAGIFENTNLGAPITDTLNATWVAKFRLGTFSEDFSLDVTFGGTTGTVDGFIPNFSGGIDFLIDGRFGANGVITGSVHYMSFASETSPRSPATFNGTLSGIIGQDGAVGVFHGVAGTTNYSGGFIAAPVPPVTADAWVSSFSSPALRTTPAAGHQFLKIVGKTISTVGANNVLNGAEPVPDTSINTLDFSDITSGGVSLGLGDNNGFVHFDGLFGGNRYYYAGIFGTTDLGAPITGNNFRATWDGKFQYLHFPYNFTLDVTFGGTTGTVVGFIKNFISSDDFLIDGTFDENGVITGSVHAAEFAVNVTTATAARASTAARNGALSGIIGRDGAVGVFYGTTSRIYRGGFVAALPPVPVTGDVWVSSFISPALSTTPTAGNKFLRLSGKTINRNGTTERIFNHSSGSGGLPRLFSLDFGAFSSGTIPLGLDANDGLVYFRGWIRGSGGNPSIRYSYAGIYASTDLGAPIVDSGMDATWAGKLRLGGVNVRNFTLNVTFGGTTGTVKAFINDASSGNYDFSINGRFGANGVITGGVHYSNVAHPTSPDDFNGTLSGIIGQDGAVGVYVINSGIAGINGGFIAAPAR